MLELNRQYNLIKYFFNIRIFLITILVYMFPVIKIEIINNIKFTINYLIGTAFETLYTC